MLGEHDLNGFFRAQIREAVREVAADAVKDAMKELAEATQGEKDVYNAKEAAEFMRFSYESFKRVAPEVDRIAISEHRYVYLRKDLLAWLESRKGKGLNDRRVGVPSDYANGVSGCGENAQR